MKRPITPRDGFIAGYVNARTDALRETLAILGDSLGESVQASLEAAYRGQASAAWEKVVRETSA